MSELLFVYGTLRKDSGHPMARWLSRRARHLGTGRFQGVLYRLGRYPGAKDSKLAAALVIGDVYELTTPWWLSRLDVYEGCHREPREFRRERRVIMMSNNTLVAAWIYLYQGPRSAGARIPSGDWFQPKPGLCSSNQLPNARISANETATIPK